MDDLTWADVTPPAELTTFLRGIKLEKLDVKLQALGYDDVDDFASYDEAARGRLRAALVEDGVPIGHAHG